MSDDEIKFSPRTKMAIACLLPFVIWSGLMEFDFVQASPAVEGAMKAITMLVGVVLYGWTLKHVQGAEFAFEGDKW